AQFGDRSTNADSSDRSGRNDPDNGSSPAGTFARIFGSESPQTDSGSVLGGAVAGSGSRGPHSSRRAEKSFSTWRRTDRNDRCFVGPALHSTRFDDAHHR